jgi:glycosyltransferase involved in cell wall biosynthesis
MTISSYEQKEPRITAIVATYNSAPQLRLTLESLEAQDYEGLEVVAVDGGSSDRTLQILHSHSLRVNRVLALSSGNRIEAYNRGAAIATGDYLMFLPPGTLLFRPTGLRELVSVAAATDWPDLLYGGYSLRLADGRTDVVALPLSETRLRRGQTPVHACASLWRTSTFLRLGKFDPHLHYQATYDLVSRLIRNPNATYLRATWVVSEYARPKETYRQLIRRHREMLYCLAHHWGFFTALRWFLSANPLDTARWWWARFRDTMLGPNALQS